jgi:tyrosyl-tRNA synthetase
MPLVADLQSRGLLAQASDPQLDEKLARMIASGKPVAAYAGFDPTADSLHVGNFVAILGLMYAQRNGIRPIAVVGGATGLIGDPSGKTSERQLQTKETVASNVGGIQRVLERFLDFNHPAAPAAIANNLDWFGPMSAIDFLRDVGKHFRIGPMLAKDSVRARMEQSAEGMSYTEFSYQLLQGYDFYRLYKDRGCVLQMGGSDQWGNITAGIDVIRKLDGESGHAFGVTLPLITTSSGQKFGKSEGNAVWLTPDKTSVFDFYQFWLRTEDADVGRYLRFFTFLPIGEIEALAADHAASPERRVAQKKLAEEMTTLVHGAEATRRAMAASRMMYGGGGSSVEQLTDESIEALAGQGVPTTTIDRAKLEAGWPVLDAVVETGLAKSKSDARRLVEGGGFYLNNHALGDVKASLGVANLATATAMVLRSGKKNYRLVRVK